MVCTRADREDHRPHSSGLAPARPHEVGGPGTGFRISTRLAMAGRKAGRGAWDSRRRSPRVEELDRRELMTAGGLRHSLRPSAGRSQFGPRITQPAKVVNAHSWIDPILSTIPGPGLDRVQANSNA